MPPASHHLKVTEEEENRLITTAVNDQCGVLLQNNKKANVFLSSIKLGVCNPDKYTIDLDERCWQSPPVFLIICFSLTMWPTLH